MLGCSHGFGHTRSCWSFRGCFHDSSESLTGSFGNCLGIFMFLLMVVVGVVMSVLMIPVRV